MTQASFRVTYATQSVDDERLHADFEEGIRIAKSWLGSQHGFSINGVSRRSSHVALERSPSDRDVVVGEFAQAEGNDVRDAVSAAQEFAPDWASTPWQERVTVLRRGADLISERRNEMAALMSIEVGKNRIEALGDVEETADLIRYYCHQMEENEGFVFTMGQLSPNEHTRSVLRPHGVWGVISPFNFPMALAGGPTGAALVAGNTVVLKPSQHGVLSGLKFHEALRDAGLPPGALQIVTGDGATGSELALNSGLDGLTFTGSYAVGMNLFRNFSGLYPKPAICEMGGKNPAIVSENADLEIAAEGVMRSAFGFSGQKCSACSRVFVERMVHDSFLDALATKTSELQIGNAIDRDVYLGPVIDEHAVGRFEDAVRQVKESGGTILLGGERLTEGDFERGNFVTPTIVEAPIKHRVFADELFIPFVAVASVDSLEEALGLCNDTTYGLTAGFYSSDPTEIDSFLRRIQAGVVYVNRRAGATTGAWPGVQPFGGWKGSGTSGKAGGGLHYVQQYMREQSQTIVRD